MQANISSLIRRASSLAGVALALSSAAALAADKTPADADAFPVFDNNYVRFSASASSLDGNEAAFQAATKNARRGYNGIEDLRFNRELSKGTSLQVDGRALGGTE